MNRGLLMPLIFTLAGLCRDRKYTPMSRQLPAQAGPSVEVAFPIDNRLPVLHLYAGYAPGGYIG